MTSVPPRAPAPEVPARALVSICVTCRSVERPDATGAVLWAALEAAGGLPAGVALRPVQCLSACKRACAAAFSGPDRYSYVFGDLDPDTGPAALLEGVDAFLSQEHGYLLWRERPEPLRRGTLARLPPLGWSTPDGRHPR